MSVLRSVLLSASESRWLRERAVRYPFVRRAVSRFMPGEAADDALAASRALGVGTVLTRLGENLVSASEADGVAKHYLDVLDRVHEERLDVEISVKLTQLGFDMDVGRTDAHLARLAERSAQAGRTLWIDMEGSAYTEATIACYERLRADHENVGLCLQAYLGRTAEDLRRLLPGQPAIRLVKGAYAEPAAIAFTSRRDVDASYLALALDVLAAAKAGGSVRIGLGTHDVGLIEQIADRAEAMGLPRTAFEVQMLYGIRTDQQRRLAAAGYAVRCLIAYGEAWYPWYMRRLAERPANVLFALRQIVG